MPWVALVRLVAHTAAAVLVAAALLWPSVAAATAELNRVFPSASPVAGGSSVTITVELTEDAPAGGAKVYIYTDKRPHDGGIPGYLTEPGPSGNVEWLITCRLTSGAEGPEVWSSVWNWAQGLGVTSVSDESLRIRTLSAGWEAWDAGRQYYYNYDDNNNVTYAGTRVERDGSVDCYLTKHEYTYGTVGNVLTDMVNGSAAEVTEYTYHNASKYFQKATVEDPLGRTTTFEYHPRSATSAGDRGNVLWVQDAGYSDPNSPSYGQQYEYGYNAYGQKAYEINLNDVRTDYTYGDAWGNLTQVVQNPGNLARTTTMLYDPAGRVTSTTDPNGQTSVFTYFADGQPHTAEFPTSIQNVAGELVTYGYDTAGRTTSVSDSHGTTSMTYEPATGRVATVADSVTGTIAYTYRATGERATMTLPGETLPWTYEYQDPETTARICLPKDDPNSVCPLLSRITDEQSRQVDYSIDVYGAPRATQGSPTSKHAFVGGLGHPTEDDTGLIYMRARWMDPVAGTFVSEDLARDGVNWFSYCRANPVNAVDRTGLTSGTDLEVEIASGESASIGAASNAALGILKGKAEEIALLLVSKYAALGALVAAGYAKNQVFAWQFRDAMGRIHLFRFDTAQGLLKHTSAGLRLGIPHHMRYVDILRDLTEIFG
jgi:RHS repeat-associated protein